MKNAIESAAETLRDMDNRANRPEKEKPRIFPLVLALAALAVELMAVSGWQHMRIGVAVYWMLVTIYWARSIK